MTEPGAWRPYGPANLHRMANTPYRSYWREAELQIVPEAVLRSVWSSESKETSTAATVAYLANLTLYSSQFTTTPRLQAKQHNSLLERNNKKVDIN